MKRRIIYYFLGKVLIGYSILFLFPILVAFIYKESIIPFLLPQIICLILGFLLTKIKVTEDSFDAKDGFLVTTLSWIIICIIGALPMVINGDLDYISAFFEIVSGFTTTGSTVFTDVEILNKSILFWRSFTHFIGGIGILAFVMAIVPLSNRDKSMHILKAEMPGPSVSKLVPSIRKTLFYLFGIYIFLTTILIILLLIGKTPLFDSILLAFGTAGTGGFAILNSSVAEYSVFSKYVIAIFMFLFGVNFNIYFLILMKDLKSAFKSEELRVYFFIFVSSVLFVFFNILNSFANLKDAFLSSFFHVSSIITSTGFAIDDINIYPTDCRILLLFLMFTSACAGSTCGGIKMSRLIICFKSIRRDIRKMIFPNSVETITFDGKKVSENTIKNTNTFLFLYLILMLIIMVIVSFDGYSLEATINAVVSTFANVGLCFDVSNFSEFSFISKLALSLGMLLGRLEIFPILALFTDYDRK